MATIPSAFAGVSGSNITPPITFTGAPTTVEMETFQTGDTQPRVTITTTGIGFGSGSVAPGTNMQFGGAGVTQFNGKVVTVNALDCNTAGFGIQVAEGSNAKQGIATLAAGTVTVANTSVTANSRIFCTTQILGTVTSASTFDTPRVVGTSFTIHASQATDTSTVAWEIFEPG